jgi:hypothetical protein
MMDTNKQTAIDVLIERRIKLEKENNPEIWALRSLFYEYEFQEKTLSFNRNVILPISGNYLFSPSMDYCYFTQYGNDKFCPYYVVVICVSDLRHDVIGYCDTKKDVKKFMSEIEKSGLMDEPEKLKEVVYNGFGKIELDWWT